MLNLDDLKDKKLFCLEQIEYMTRALEKYKLDLAEVEEAIKAQESVVTSQTDAS